MIRKIMTVASLCSVMLTLPLLGQEARKQLTVEEIFGSSMFRLKSLSSVRWVGDGKMFSYIETDTATKEQNLYLYSVADGTRELVMSGSSLVPKQGEKPLRIGSYEWSSDGDRVLVTGTLPARRTKSGGSFGVFDPSSGEFRVLSDTTAEQAIVKFSPDGSMIGFVRSNNLFVLDVESGKETQLTFDGSDDIINGKFDWVYEEEFSIIDGWEWSPDGKRIAFWRLDQSGVPTFPLVRYPVDSSHAQVEFMRYPKAGEANSLVRIGVVDVESKEIMWLDVAMGKDIYIPRLKWTHDAEVLSLQRLNRGQDTLELILAQVTTGAMNVVLTETDTTWIDIRDDLTFLERTDQFLWTSDRDGFTHIYLYNNDGALDRQVTRGEWEVTELVSVDERRKTIYFIGTEASPLERHLYSIRLDGTGLRRLTRDPGWHSVNFSPSRLVYIDTYSSTKKPTGISLRTNDGTRIAQLVENRLDVLNTYPAGEHRFFSFRTSDGENLNGWMILPPDFQPSARYPVLMYVYGGPGSQTVVNRWGGSNYLWYQMLAQRGYIVASVDNRGTGARGKMFMHQIHRQLGIMEVNDQIEAARYLGGLPYVDSSRIGIWGWSGGGYMTCLAMTLGADYFKTGIAVAPVTNWKFYDTIYTERYMDTPENNPDGYAQTSPLSHASRLKGNLLIIHGTADDNVHWQNTVTFIDELIKQGKQVHTMFYPGRAHGISGAAQHLYTMMTNYIVEKL